MTPTHPLLESLRPAPLIAILRGLEPEHAVATGQALVAAGFKALEVPLNRPGALQCIALLARELPNEILVGGGTVLTAADVDAVYAAGGRLVVSPNTSAAVIARTVALGMLSAPGVATPTEAFLALQAGAHALKLFPCDMVGLGGLKALKSVLPAHIDLWPVGGITPQNMAAWKAAGATGFGIGSQLFSPGATPEQLQARGQDYMSAWSSL